MRLAWHENGGPDCLFQISYLANVAEETYLTSKPACIRRLNKAVNDAIETLVHLKISKLGKETTRISRYSDSSFANKNELLSHLGHIVFLSDSTNAFVPFSCKPHKSRRATCCVISGEVIAFGDMFDMAIAPSKDLSTVLGKHTPAQLFTDSKSLFDIISKGSKTSEKRTMLVVVTAREGFLDRLISDIRFIRSSCSIADGLTQLKIQASMRTVLSSGMREVRSCQWMIRDQPMT